ncbi:hypothetical protein [Fusobacterium ulcerans]|uniref:hypothetical protein n=1 Tax=Fusobacterium ulcerans TaxID=861 RepID=UPI003FEDFCEF
MIINIEKAKEYEITPQDLAVYYCLIQNEGKISNKELKCVLGPSYRISDIASICSKLEDRKLIKRYLSKTNKVQYEILINNINIAEVKND